MFIYKLYKYLTEATFVHLISGRESNRQRQSHLINKYTVERTWMTSFKLLDPDMSEVRYTHRLLYYMGQ